MYIGLSTRQKRIRVLDQFDLRINRGESVVLIGPSGCGKSTLLYLLAGLLRPTAGRVMIEGADVAGPRRQTGFILQEYGLFPWLNVEENIRLGLKIRHEALPAARETIERILAEMGLAQYRKHYPSQLSGGQRQRVALARILTLRPDLLLMDEPLSSLDALTRERLQNLLLDIWKKGDITTVLVTHSIEEAVFLGNRIIVLANKQPTFILNEIANLGMGSRTYRNTEDFFKTTNQIRALLEGGAES